MRLYKTNKQPFSIKNNAKKFLNGITSNVMDAPNNAFLDIRGRIIATFDQVQTNEDEYIILVEAPFVHKVLEHIDKYVKLSGAVVQELDNKVYFDLDNSFPLEKGEHAIQQKAGKLIISKRDLKCNISEEEFTLFRLKNNIPLHGIDYKDEMLLNISVEDFVSFTKGCYLGQEPISKVYNRSKPTWRLVAKHENDCSDEEKDKMTSKVFDENKKEIGFIFEKNTQPQ